jgi:hypothetical protein
VLAALGVTGDVAGGGAEAAAALGAQVWVWPARRCRRVKRLGARRAGGSALLRPLRTPLFSAAELGVAQVRAVGAEIPAAALLAAAPPLLASGGGGAGGPGAQAAFERSLGVFADMLRAAVARRAPDGVEAVAWGGALAALAARAGALSDAAADSREAGAAPQGADEALGCLAALAEVAHAAGPLGHVAVERWRAGLVDAAAGLAAARDPWVWGPDGAALEAAGDAAMQAVAAAAGHAGAPACDRPGARGAAARALAAPRGAFLRRPR